MLGALFIGDLKGALKFVAGGQVYTYILHRPDGRPFYVGQGTGDRLRAHARDANVPGAPNQFKCNVIRKIEREGGTVVYRIDAFHADRQAADLREIELIKAIGRLCDGGPLTNQVAGGGGTSDPSPEVRAKRAASLGGIPEEPGPKQTVNRVLLSFEPDRESIGIKPLKGKFKPVRLTRFREGEKPFTIGSLPPRCAMTLGVAAILSGVVIEPGCRIPRRVDIEGVPAIIENGLGRRILSGETCTIEGDIVGEEVFIPDEIAVAQIIAVVGRQRLEDAGALPATSDQRNMEMKRAT